MPTNKINWNENMVERMTRVETKVEDTRRDVQEIKAMLTNLPNTFDKRYASKEAVDTLKKYVYAAATALGIAAIGFVVWMVQKAIENGVFR